MVVTYDTETRVNNNKIIHKMQVQQRAFERKLLKISLKDKNTNKWMQT